MTLDYELLRIDLKQKGTDFDRLADGQGKPIEDKIKPLLLVLNYLGYSTVSSCEGHSIQEHKRRIEDDSGTIVEESEYHFVLEKSFGGGKGSLFFSQAPFVDLDIDQQKFQRLDSIVQDYNSINTIPWKFKKFDKYFRLSPDYTHKLKELQSTIPLVANYVFARHQ